MKWKIYKVTNKINGKKYIGITSRSIEGRFKEHCRTKKVVAERNYSYGILGEAIAKYGKENFHVEEIDEAESSEEALEKESNYIQSENTLAANGHGYNLVENSFVNAPTPETISYSINTRKSNKKKSPIGIINPTRFVGVFFLQERNRWSWSFRVNGKRVTRKNFSTDFDAALDRDIELTKYFTKMICSQTMNFPNLYQDILDGKIENPKRVLKQEPRKSRFHFISYDKEQKTWRVRIAKKNKTIVGISGFQTQEEAAEVADHLNWQTINDEKLINFPERKIELTSLDYKIPKTKLQLNKVISYQNISIDTKPNGVTWYRICLQNNGVRHRNAFKTLEEAVKFRDQLREQYDLPKAIDFPD